jgi:hypothetical protein
MISTENKQLSYIYHQFYQSFEKKESKKYPLIELNKKTQNLKVKKYNTKLKFHCDSCRSKWTSSEGIIELIILERVFHIKFLGKQACKNCNSFISPTMYEEEVDRICEKILNPTKKKNKKISNMKKEHDVKRCEACLLNKHKEINSNK